MTQATAKVADRRWRMQHSIWLLVPAFGIGLFTFASFLYIGLRTRHRPWLLAAAGYFAASVVAFVAFSGPSPAPGEPTPAIQNVGGTVMIAAWIGGFVHALIANRRYLPMLAQRQPWHAQYQSPAPQAGSMAPPPVGGDAAASMGLTADQEDFWGAPASPPPRQTAPNAPLAAPRPKPAPVNTPRQDVAHTMDLNTAAESDLASLPGIGPVLAKRIVAERSSRGGFSNVEQLAEIGVPPHVVVRLRPLVAFSQLPGARRPRGRIVDV